MWDGDELIRRGTKNDEMKEEEMRWDGWLWDEREWEKWRWEGRSIMRLWWIDEMKNWDEMVDWKIMR